FAANEALNILQTCVPAVTPGYSLASMGPANATYWHLLIEAKKLAYADLYRYNADPDVDRPPLERLLAPSHAAALCSKIDPKHASVPAPPGPDGGRGDTVVLSTADRWGNMVSLVNSNYDEFGSGITVPGYGFILHDRGGLFSLDPRSPNAICAAQTPVQYALRGLYRAERASADDARADGRRYAGAGTRANRDRHRRPARERAASRRHGALPARRDFQHAVLGIAALRTGRRTSGNPGAQSDGRDQGADGRLPGNHAFTQRSLRRRFGLRKRRPSRGVVERRFQFAAGPLRRTVAGADVWERSSRDSCAGG